MRYDKQKRATYSLSNNEQILKVAKKQLAHRKQKTNNNQHISQNVTNT